MTTSIYFNDDERLLNFIFEIGEPDAIITYDCVAYVETVDFIFGEYVICGFKNPDGSWILENNIRDAETILYLAHHCPV